MAHTLVGRIISISALSNAGKNRSYIRLLVNEPITKYNAQTKQMETKYVDNVIGFPAYGKLDSAVQENLKKNDFCKVELSIRDVKQQGDNNTTYWSKQLMLTNFDKMYDAAEVEQAINKNKNKNKPQPEQPFDEFDMPMEHNNNSYDNQVDPFSHNYFG